MTFYEWMLGCDILLSEIILKRLDLSLLVVCLIIQSNGNDN
jgi:hypothetical protein